MATNISRYRKPISCLRDIAAARFASLKRECNNSGHGLDAQTYGIPLSCGGSFKNSYSNLCLACPCTFPRPSRFPSFIQNGLQEFQGLGTVRVHSVTPHSLLLLDYTYRPPHARYSSVLCEPPFPTTRLYDCIMCRGVAGRLTSIHLQRMRVPFSSDAPGQSPLPGAFILCVKISGATWAQRSCRLWVKSGHLQCKTACPSTPESGHSERRL